MRFSPKISKTKTNLTDTDKTGYRYRIKFENYGIRNILDIEILSRLRIQGIEPFSSTNWQIVRLPLSSYGDPEYRIPRLFPISKKKSSRHIIRLCINETPDIYQRTGFSAEIRKKASDRILLLEDLLEMGKKANLEIIAFGYDEFSGTRKIFFSKKYNTEDIEEGPFMKNSLEINKAKSGKNELSFESEED